MGVPDPTSGRRPLPQRQHFQKHRQPLSSTLSPHSAGSNNRRRPQLGSNTSNATRGGSRWIKGDEGRSHQKVKSPSSAAIAAKTRKTKTKPKHLKRKLAALEEGTGSADAASDDRRRLQQQLEQWESGKRAYQERKRQRKEEAASSLSFHAPILDRNAAKNKRPTHWQSPSTKGKNLTPVQGERGSSQRPTGTSYVSSTLASTAQRFPQGQPTAADARPSHHKPSNIPSLKSSTAPPAVARVTIAAREPSRDAPESRHEDVVDDDAGEHRRDGDSKPLATEQERAKRRRGRRKTSEEEDTSGSLNTPMFPPSAASGSRSEAPDAKKDLASDNGGDDAVENDSDGETQPLAMKRERGKRRRRSRKAQGELDDGSSEVTPASPTLQAPKDKGIVISSAAAATREGAANDEARSSKGASKPNETDGTKARYCVGRKPVTDFAVGQSYDGKVVYAKPFGVFLDIGCHSDAFCHVSRLSDDYVDDPETRFRPGDAVVARVVEIDRPRKRITVSLQSEARMADEIASMNAKRERRQRQHPPQQQPQPKPQPRQRDGKAEDRPDSASAEPASPQLSPDQRKLTCPGPLPNPASHPTIASSSSPGPIHDPTPQDLKRARKLERRAARRADAGMAGRATTQ